jgi:hypothetical protein
MAATMTTSFPMRDLHRLTDAVQRNCHISDARHAREMTMCTYLLEMREFYRWEHETPFHQQPRKEELGSWLSEREALWSELEDDTFGSLPVGAERYDPFAADAVNRALVPAGLVYGGGYGRFHKPHFFLGQLLRRERREEFDVLVSGCEYARDLTTMPAAYQSGTIYLRQDALRRWLWEKVELWGVRRADGALGRALQCYGFDADPEAALVRMTDGESESAIAHEIGEGRAESLLGSDWQAMLSSLSRRRAEVLARAVRDNLADCLSTLPYLLESEAQCALHFYFANFEGMRRALSPRLAAAYGSWCESGNAMRLREATDAGQSHWAAVALRLLDLYRSDPSAAEPDMEALAAEGVATLAL